MRTINNIERDGECRIACLVKKMALQEELVHEEFGLIFVNEWKDNDIAIKMDGNDMIIRIASFDDKRKYSYITWSLIDPKTGKTHAKAVTPTSLENAQIIRAL